MRASTLLMMLLFLLGCGDDGDNGAGPGPANHAPVLSSQRDTTAVLADTLRLWAVATDEDGDSLTYGVTVDQTLAEIRDGHLVDAHMNRTTGAFWFWPQVPDRPGRDFHFTVHDGRGGRDTTDFWVAVP